MENRIVWQNAHSSIAPPFSLTAHQHPLITALVKAHSSDLHRLVDGLGSPLHFLLPQVFEENIKQIQQVFEENGLTGAILFAKKANKADCFTRACAKLGIGVDVASTEELVKALAAGVTGDKIGVSGPEKDDSFIALCLRHCCLVAIDSVNELHRIISMAGQSESVANVLLRCRIGSQRSSRFGLTPQERDIGIALCLAHSESINLHGFSFHLGGYSTPERARAANEMIDLCVDARSRGLSTCCRVDIGGGLAVQYVDSQRWADFLDQNASDHYHADRTFGGFYPYGTTRPGAHALRDILQFAVSGETRLAEKAKRYGIDFIVEPGRALLDQAGFTVFDVQGVKDRHPSEGYAIVTVRGSSFSLSEQWFNSEFLPDPLLIPRQESDGGLFVACIGGSTCLENDMLTWRKVGFPRPIRVGDRLVYFNTAGYQMDSNESPFHDVGLPRKVVLEFRGDDEGPRWQLDGI